MAKVLIVDDAAFMRLRLRTILQPEGHTVIEAANGAEAVKAYAEQRPDVVFLDITMPEMDGLQALRAIRAADGEAYVIMCSALGQQSMVLQAIQDGASDFIVKPFQPERVLEAVKSIEGVGAKS